ncbi:hypothetical protein Tco_0517610 [Tanacetum coccineum]
MKKKCVKIKVEKKATLLKAIGRIGSTTNASKSHGLLLTLKDKDVMDTRSRGSSLTALPSYSRSLKDSWVSNSLVHSLCTLSTLRRFSLRTASTAEKPCQGDSSEFYLITGSIYTDEWGTVGILHVSLLQNCRIIAVTKLQIVEWHNYKHLDWITIRRNDDKLLQEALSSKGVEDLQLGVKSYQKKLNLTKPVMRMASAAAKPCQGDSSEFYLITGSIYTDQRETVELPTIGAADSR